MHECYSYPLVKMICWPFDVFISAISPCKNIFLRSIPFTVHVLNGIFNFNVPPCSEKIFTSAITPFFFFCTY